MLFRSERSCCPSAQIWRATVNSSSTLGSRPSPMHRTSAGANIGASGPLTIVDLLDHLSWVGSMTAQWHAPLIRAEARLRSAKRPPKCRFALPSSLFQEGRLSESTVCGFAGRSALSVATPIISFLTIIRIMRTFLHAGLSGQHAPMRAVGKDRFRERARGGSIILRTPRLPAGVQPARCGRCHRRNGGRGARSRQRPPGRAMCYPSRQRALPR